MCALTKMVAEGQDYRTTELQSKGTGNENYFFQIHLNPG